MSPDEFYERYYPVIDNIGFLEVDPKIASKSYLDWQILINRGWNSVRQKQVEGKFDDVFGSLFPLRGDATRTLFVPTMSTRWTAIFGNSVAHMDIASPIGVLSEITGARSIIASFIPHSYRKIGKNVEGRDISSGRYGGTQLQIIDPKIAPGPLHYLRVVSAVNDGGPWSFRVSGMQQAFEEPDAYKAKKVRDRFTPEMLDRYLKAMGISAFDPGFYMPAGSQAILVEKSGKIDQGAKDFTLEEARSAITSSR